MPLPPARRRLLVAVLSLVVPVTDALAQCPEGTPPPCGRRPAAASSPAINPKEWIVVPFGNVTRAQDMDWLRDASVNLLTMEIGRWTDVQVVNDKRVADLLRTLPAERRAQALALSDGIAIAKRAGAGMLVMGDFVKFGKGARLSANVFDVRTGARVRSVEQRIGDPDSLLSAFGPLSRSVLAVPPPPDARSGDIGTTKLAAYQAYLDGVRAMNRWDLDVAESHLERALTIDSTFALAHYWIAIKLGWTEVAANNATPRSVTHALAAQRLGVSLPPRERALIETELAVARSDYGAACKAVAPLVARDSNDIMALYQLGECNYHDNIVIPPATNTEPGRRRASWNTSLAMMRRVLELDPSFHLAFEHVLDILRSVQVGGCVQRAPAVVNGPCEAWPASVLRDGDTLLIRPVSLRDNRDGMFAQADRAIREKPLIANLTLARYIAEEWLAADPKDDRARRALAEVLSSLGDVEASYAQWQRVPGSSLMQGDDGTDTRGRMEVAAKAGKGADARAWFDSLVKSVPDSQTAGVFRGSMDLMFAHAARLRSYVAPGAAPETQAYFALASRGLLGLPTPGMGAAEAAYLASMKDEARCSGDCRLGRVPTLRWALREPRASWPTELATTTNFIFLSAKAMALGDTVALRRAAAALDSSARVRVAAWWPDDGHAINAADAYLVLRDSMNALRMARFAVDSAMRLNPIARQHTGGYSPATWWPRAMLLRADLAAGLGQTDEARKWYDRVLDLWATADPEFQGDVARIKAARARLGSPITP